MGRKDNYKGSVRRIESSGKWECVVQSKYINPDTGKPKRIKRTASTEKEATEAALMELARYEKAFQEGSNQKVDRKKRLDSICVNIWIRTSAEVNCQALDIFHTAIA